MKNLTIVSTLLLSMFLAGKVDAQTKNASEKQEDNLQKFSVADGWLNFEAPASWKKVPPKINFIHADFKIPKVEGDSRDGRISFSQVGGGTDANLNRWIGQFKDIDAENEEQVQRETKQIDGQTVKMLMVKGTFLDSAGGPFGPKTERENYVLLGAAIESKNGANVYVKAYGPEKTMKANKKALEKLMKTMKASDG